MRSLSFTAASFALRLAVSFVVIVLVLATASIVYGAYIAHQSSDAEVASLQGARKSFDEWRSAAETGAAERVAGLQTASDATLDRRVAEIDAALHALAAPGTLRRIMQIASVSAASDALLQTVERNAQVALLRREREIVVQLREFKAGPRRLQDRQHAFLEADAAVKQNRYLQLALLRDHPFLARVPQTAQRRELARLEHEYDQLTAHRQQVADTLELQRNLTAALQPPERVAERLAQATNDAQRQLDAHIGEREREKARSWVGVATRAVERVGMTAAWILFAIVVTPIAIKVVFYYILAPLAARRPPIVALPHASGALPDLADATARPPHRANVSSVSLPLSLRPEEVLLLHPDFLQSSGAGTHMKTQWLLDWKYPFASLAAGMRMLIRIRADRSDVVVVSATQDPLIEVGVLSLPEGASFVLFPRNLVGTVHPAAVPLRITSVWRIWSLHAWLTLQMRYLVFHGPAQLIVKGCRGVRVESAHTGRRINQAATIGWSANLRYTTSRSETFAAYLFGQRELLNDSFAGGDGYFVYEEIPDRRRAGGIVGRGLEGMTDTVLKVFGV